MNTKLVFILIVFSMLVGCRSPLHTVIQHDTVYNNTRNIEVLYDSVYIRDSIYIHEKNDTVYLYKYYTKYIQKNRTDTIIDTAYVNKVDYQQVVVEKRYTPWYMKACTALGLIVIVLFVGYVYIKHVI